MALSAPRRTRTSKAGSASGSPDAIALLKADHHTVEWLFRGFERAGERAHKTRRKLLELGTELREAKRRAPELPHPRLTDFPVEHIVPNALTTVIGKVMDAAKSVRPASHEGGTGGQEETK